MNGDTHTGVALIRIDPKRIDVGAVVSLTDAKVDPADTYDTWVPRDREASHTLAMLVVHPAAHGSSSPVACLSSS
jgi:methionyl-tRNA formyltransferase